MARRRWGQAQVRTLATAQALRMSVHPKPKKSAKKAVKFGGKQAEPFGKKPKKGKGK